VTTTDLKTVVCIHAFDLLYLNGDSLLKKNFIDRRTLLHNNFKQEKGKFYHAVYQDAEKFEDIETFLADSIRD